MALPRAPLPIRAVSAPRASGSCPPSSKYVKTVQKLPGSCLPKPSSSSSVPGGSGFRPRPTHLQFVKASVQGQWLGMDSGSAKWIPTGFTLRPISPLGSSTGERH